MATLPLSIRELGVLAVALDFAIDATIRARMDMRPGDRAVVSADASLRDLRALRARLPVPVLG